MMNPRSISSPSQTLFNSPNKPLISSLPSFNFNNIHVRTPQISIRTPNLTTKAAAATSVRTASPEPETLYDLLGISENGTLSDIKQAYKRMALKYHPDVSPPETAEEYTVRFIRVQEAYETLSDPETRSLYDRGMAKGLHLVFSGRNGARFDPRSEEKSRWKDTWSVQVSELARRSRANPNRGDPTGGMSWGARMRKQRRESCVNGSGQDQ